MTTKTKDKILTIGISIVLIGLFASAMIYYWGPIDCGGCCIQRYIYNDSISTTFDGKTVIKGKDGDKFKFDLPHFDSLHPKYTLIEVIGPNVGFDLSGGVLGWHDDTALIPLITKNMIQTFILESSKHTLVKFPDTVMCIEPPIMLDSVGWHVKIIYEPKVVHLKSIHDMQQYDHSLNDSPTTYGSKKH